MPHGGMIQLSAFQFFKTSSRYDPESLSRKDTLVSTLAFLLPNFFVEFRYDPHATLLYGTRKNFPVYGSLTAVPGANALTST